MATRKAQSITTADLIVSEDDVVVSPRGRKTETDPVLMEAFQSLQPGQALNLAPIFGAVEGSKARQAVGSTIRKNWKAARPDDKCRIDYHPTTGAPQVRIRS
jgi:hypothetical protein